METENKLEESVKKTESEKTSDIPFKKPILIGKIGRLPRKIPQKETLVESSPKVENQKIEEDRSKCINPEPQSAKVLITPTLHDTENNIPLPYKEPVWSGLPQSIEKDYIFEVLKNGSIIETINVMTKPFWVFGRLANCNICMQHPTISRYHAILQYRTEPSEKEEAGFYIYDLGSTHGTFLNKNRLKPRVYTRIQVGHMLKLGCSTRKYILNGPEEDTEDESEFTVTELKQRRAEELKRREEEEALSELKAQQEEEERKKKLEERGVDWGLGEDADEETDLSENPFAQSNNEELYLDDPKKALRGFFEREGIDFEYDCREQGMGQYVCKVDLPIDDEHGRPVVAEVIHSGKKKEAVIQCALEACRLLDRAGVLRQSTHESRKRKAKNWEENDFYDSDDDTFLDRTGTIEKKREARMKAKAPQKAETYESLVEKEKSISQSISKIEKQLSEAELKFIQQSRSNNDEDSLDSYMKELKQSKPDKTTINKLKAELTKLKAEQANVIRLANVAKPASLPPLVAHNSAEPGTSKGGSSKAVLPIFGKRKKIKLQLPARGPQLPHRCTSNSAEDVEEEDENEEVTDEGQNTHQVESTQETQSNPPESNEPQPEASNPNNQAVQEPEDEIQSNSSSDGDIDDILAQGSDLFMDFSLKSINNTMTFKKFEKIMKTGLPPFANQHQEKLAKILNSLKRLASNEDRMHVDWKILAAKKRKVMKLIADLRTCEPNGKLEHRVASELNRILGELNNMTEEKYKVIGKVKKMGNEIKNISEAIDKECKRYLEEQKSITPELVDDDQPSTSSNCDAKELANRDNSAEQDQIMESDEESKNDASEKKKKKNQRRIQQRLERAEAKTEMERQRGYEEDATREDYSMWVPPENQTGDGRTSLNDKLGY